METMQQPLHAMPARSNLDAPVRSDDHSEDFQHHQQQQQQHLHHTEPPMSPVSDGGTFDEHQHQHHHDVMKPAYGHTEAHQTEADNATARTEPSSAASGRSFGSSIASASNMRFSLSNDHIIDGLPESPGMPSDDDVPPEQRPVTAGSHEGPRFMDATTPMMFDDINHGILAADPALSNNQTPGHATIQSVDLAGKISLNAEQNIAPLWKNHLCELLYEHSTERKAIVAAYQQMLDAANASAPLEVFGPQRHVGPEDAHLDIEADVDLSQQHQQQHQQQQQGFLLISGPSGSGKTTLAKTLASTVVADGGHFLIGKFDQLEQPQPYVAFATAFTAYTRNVLQRDYEDQHQRGLRPHESTKARVKHAIYEAVGHEVGILTNVIPALMDIIGTDVPPVPSGHEHALCRFMHCMRAFLRVICSPQQPIVLVLDDLQYADCCSLKLMRSLVLDQEVRGLIIVGTCLCTISPKSRLSIFLRTFEDETDTCIRNISLDIAQDITSMLADTFSLSDDVCRELSEVICEQTKGNMLYIVEFVRYLVEEGLLKFTQGRWSWNIDEIRLVLESNQIGDFLVDKLSRLPVEVQDTVRVASCLGANVDKLLLDLIFGQDQTMQLTLAAEHGILVLQEETKEYRFVTDAIQKAAHSLVPEEERDFFHLQLGRSMLKLLDKQLVEEKLFSVLSQFRIGARHIVEDTERQAISMMCLHAGKMSVGSSAFKAAADYLDFGLLLLPDGDDKWNSENKDLTLAMYNAAAEVQVCLADTERLDELLDTVISCRLLHRCDKLGAYCTRIYSLGQRDRQAEAIDMGVEVLKHMGETFPMKHCSFLLMREARGVFRLLKGKSDEDILGMPHMTDHKLLIAMRILNIISLDTLCARPKFTPFVILKMMSITLRHGLSEHASSSFGLFGMLMLNVNWDIDNAYRFGTISMTLLDQFGLDQYLPRVYASFYGVINTWKRPLREALQPLCQAHKVALLTGDLEFAALTANIGGSIKIQAGSDLNEVAGHCRYMHEWAKAHNQITALNFACVNRVFVEVLVGQRKYPLDMERAVKELGGEDLNTDVPVVQCGINCTMLTLHYMFGDFKAAESCFQKSAKEELREFGVALGWTYEALTRLALARQGIKKRKHIRKVLNIVKNLKHVSAKCPENFADKLFLVQGELASVLGKHEKAYSKLTYAASLAGSSNFLDFEASANERLGWHIARQHNPNLTHAKTFFDKAISGYEKWGASAKAEHLRDEVSSVIGITHRT